MKWGPNGHLAQWIIDQFPPGYQGHAIDVGASDGVSISTTYHLENPHRWTVLCVEPNPQFHKHLLAHRAMVEKVACDAEPGDDIPFHVNLDNAEAYSSLRVTTHPAIREAGKDWQTIQVPVRTVDQLLAKWQFPKLDALCIDVEGTEVDVMRGCDLARWQPKVIIAESWTPLAARAYLEPFGYKPVGRNVHNDLYVREDV